jgi:5-methylcytosine-specific restriction endonuclease McrA
LAKLRPEWRDLKRSRRKAEKLKRRATVVETVNLLHVLERDNWTCMICGAPTPRHLRGTYEPNAPEVDHIIPVSKGGEHSYRNTQCACRRCNGLKSDAMPIAA